MATLKQDIIRQKDIHRCLSSGTNEHDEAMQNSCDLSVLDPARTGEQGGQETGQDASVVQTEDEDLRAEVAALRNEVTEMKKAYHAKFQELTRLSESFSKQEKLVEEVFETVDLLCESVDGVCNGHTS